MPYHGYQCLYVCCGYLGTVVTIVTNIILIWLPQLQTCVWMPFPQWLPNLPVFISCYGYTDIPQVFCSMDIFSLVLFEM
jgi:hypothetical protein